MSVYLVSRSEGGISKYRQIHDLLVEEISDQYQAGDYLPSETDLAERFGVNRHTLRRAIDSLIDDGIVERHHGKGVFVLESSINYSIASKTRFTESLQSKGHTTSSRVRRKQIIPARGGVAAQLQINEGEDVLFIETVRDVENKPFCIISHFLPLDACPKLFEGYDGGSLHTFLYEQCGIELIRNESLVSSVLPDADDARLLNMSRNAPVLRVKSTNLDTQSKKPIEYVITRFRGDATQLSFKP